MMGAKKKFKNFTGILAGFLSHRVLNLSMSCTYNKVTV